MTALLVFALLVSHASLALSVMAYLRARDGVSRDDLEAVKRNAWSDRMKLFSLEDRLTKELAINESSHGAISMRVDEKLEEFRRELEPRKEVLHREDETK